MLLPAVTADGLSASEAVAAMDACCPEGASLLHVAVGTGCVPLVACLSAWGAPLGAPWLVDAPAGSEGVTPLHVAALLPNWSAMKAALAGMAPSVDKLWGLVQAHDGTTPESLCEALAAAAAAVPEPSAASTASTSSGGGGAGTSSAALVAAVEAPSGSKPTAELEVLAEGGEACLLFCWNDVCFRAAGGWRRAVWIETKPVAELEALAEGGGGPCYVAITCCTLPCFPLVTESSRRSLPPSPFPLQKPASPASQAPRRMTCAAALAAAATAPQ